MFWAIRKGLVTGPELSDSDSESHSASDSDEETDRPHNQARPARAYGTFNGQNSQPEGESPHPSAEADSLESSAELFPNTARHSPAYHLFHLLIGFVSLLISAFVLSHAATTLVDELGLSDEVFGLVVLSIATTLPEKLVAVVSGARGQAGIMVANTVGSNIFLLTLCLGIVWVSPSGNGDSRATVGVTELGTLLASSVAMCVAVCARGSVAKTLGLGMLVVYVAFLVLEVTVIRHGP